MFWTERRIRDSAAMRTLNADAEVRDTKSIEWGLLLSFLLQQAGLIGRKRAPLFVLELT